MKQYEEYYTQTHSGHRLTWHTGLGSGQVLCKFRNGPKDLQVHTYQMCILYLYNRADTFTYQDIVQLTQIPEKELQRHLLSLAHPKVKILKKEPLTKACALTDKFTYNEEYSSKQFRIKVRTLALQGEANDGPTEGSISEAVLEARKNRVEAAIVRIMKARQRLEHNNLVAEVVKQLSTRFPADPSFIKKRIESLIEREYLQRDENDRKVYQYLA